MLIATISTQRSGTKFLGQILSSGSEVVSYGEIFNPDSRQAFSFKNYKDSPFFKKNDQSSEQVLDSYFESLLSICKIAHFDLMFNQIEYCCTSWNPFSFPFIYDYLMSRRVVILHLQRDLESSFISQSVLHKTGVAHQYRDDLTNNDGLDLILERQKFEKYSNNVLQSRRLVADRFAEYPFFCNVNFDEIQGDRDLPQKVYEIIRSSGERLGIAVDTKSIRGREPTVMRSTRDVNVQWV